MLCAVSMHYDKLCELQKQFDSVRTSHFLIAVIDKPLCSDNYTSLLEILGFTDENKKLGHCSDRLTKKKNLAVTLTIFQS